MVDSIAGLGEGKVVHVVHQAPPAASTSTSTSTSSTPAAPAAPAGVPPAGGATAPQQPQQPQPQPPPFAIPGADPHVNQVFYRTWVLFLHLILIVPQLLSNILSGFGMMPGAVRLISTLIYAHLLAQRTNSRTHWRICVVQQGQGPRVTVVNQTNLPFNMMPGVPQQQQQQQQQGGAAATQQPQPQPTSVVRRYLHRSRAECLR